MIVSSKFELDQLQFDGSGARGLHNESHCLVKKCGSPPTAGCSGDFENEICKIYESQKKSMKSMKISV